MFQLRSLYPDKEHEAKYTELVRGYLDFDVEMEQVGAFWRHSDSLLKDFNNQQNELRKRQKMFREDLEKFKKTKLAEGPSKRSLDFASRYDILTTFKLLFSARLASNCAICKLPYYYPEIDAQTLDQF